MPIFVFLLSGCGASTSNNNQPGNAMAISNTTQKFADQPYFKNAYLVSSDTLSAEAKLALTGFQLTKQIMADGTMQIILKATNPAYRDQTYTLKNDQQLYFIEKFLGDDGNDTEANTNDDSAVIVDSQGNIVQPPSTF